MTPQRGRRAPLLFYLTQPGANTTIGARKWPKMGNITTHSRQAGSKRTIEARDGRAEGSLAMMQAGAGIGFAVVEVARPEYRHFGALLISKGFRCSEETRLSPRSLRNVGPGVAAATAELMGLLLPQAPAKPLLSDASVRLQ